MLLSGPHNGGGQHHNWTVDLPVSGPHVNPCTLPQLRKPPRIQTGCQHPPHTGPRLKSTHGIEEHSEEELAPIDDLVQLTGASRVFVVEDGVCEEATGLPREDLGGSGRWDMVSPVMVQKIRLLPQDKGWSLLGKMLPYEATKP